MAGGREQPQSKLQLKHAAVSWHDLAHTLGPILILSALAIALGLHYASPAPPHELTISTGPAGSTFEVVAERYKKILARNGVTLNVVRSAGSLQNLDRLIDTPARGEQRVDIAFVQSGLQTDGDTNDLESLGRMFYQPLTVFYRSAHPLQRLADFRGQRIAVGPEGSGTRMLALALLKANGIQPQQGTTLLPLEGEAAMNALLQGQVEGIFLSGDSAAPSTLRALLHDAGVRLFAFEQADAYVRQFPYLSKLLIPAGAFDLGENLPSSDTNMLAPTVELLTRPGLHPALCDLLIEAAYEVHGRASLLQSAGQFPNPTSTAYPLSPEAARYYKSGNRMFTYRYLPFWFASLLNRLFVVLVPIAVVLIPGLRFLPQLYGWRVGRRIHRRYGELMALERKALGPLTEEQRAALLERLEQIERTVIHDKIPGSHAEQLYVLREHIEFARSKLARPDARSGA